MLQQSIKEQVIQLRESGLSLSIISKQLGVNRNSVASIYKRSKEKHVDRCKYCGVVIRQTAGHRQRLFCSDKCRIKWWRENSTNHVINNKCICPVCKKEFIYHERRTRKYCSRSCAYKGRKKEVSGNEREY